MRTEISNWALWRCTRETIITQQRKQYRLLKNVTREKQEIIINILLNFEWVLENHSTHLYQNYTYIFYTDTLMQKGHIYILVHD